jgi:hypothetical protein
MNGVTTSTEISQVVGMSEYAVDDPENKPAISTEEDMLILRQPFPSGRATSLRHCQVCSPARLWLPRFIYRSQQIHHS